MRGEEELNLMALVGSIIAVEWREEVSFLQLRQWQRAWLREWIRL